MIERSTFANSKYISAASLTRQRDAAATYLQNVISLQFPPLIPLIDCLLHVFFEKGAKSFHFAEKGRFWGFFWGFWRVFGGDILK